MHPLFPVVQVYMHTVQNDLLTRRIFGEFVSEIQLVDFILTILL